MYTFTFDSRSNSSEWNEEARALNGGFFHCYEHTLFAAHLAGHQPLFAKGLDEHGACVGVAAGTVGRSRWWPFSRFCKRVEFSSVPACAKDHLQAADMLAALEMGLKREGVFEATFASYDSPTSRSLLRRNGYRLGERDEFVIPLTASLEDIWKGLASEKRTAIRKAEKSDVVTCEENSQEALELVYRFHRQSMERRGRTLGNDSRRIELSKRHLLDTGRAVVLVTRAAGHPVNAALFGLFNQKAYFLTSGSSDQGNRNRGPVHLLWTAIGIFKERQFTVLNLGGAKHTEPGLHRFKSQFGAEVLDEPSGRRVLSAMGAVLNCSRSLVRGGSR